ncbi:hypothetical protein KSP39_PZI015853 [Platanthera zijinensis]|uniref:Uncharacterized protein n=1 Tax=Platanthera zijinensis TaxID=2320716 RepID=A0AAP0G1K1_9ASPA
MWDSTLPFVISPNNPKISAPLHPSPTNLRRFSPMASRKKPSPRLRLWAFYLQVDGFFLRQSLDSSNDSDFNLLVPIFSWSYHYKRVVPGSPLDDLKLSSNTVGSLVWASILKREMAKLPS